METVNAPLRVLFVYLALPRTSRADMEADVTELWQLVETMGNAVVVDIIQQKGPEFDETFIGPGKVEEISGYVETNPVDCIIFNGRLLPRQKFTLIKKFWKSKPNLLVWDRTDLILEIFSRHARTKAAKLQIDLARMYSMGPRIYGMGMVLSRQGGGIGTRGIGETNTELMRRHWKREIKRAKDELENLIRIHKRQIDNRKGMGLKTVSLVGYTNAGKTTLFNAITHKKNYAADALFATLDSTVGETYVRQLGTKLLFSDTIGFIANLPPSLIEAFKTTLLESVHADIVVHVVDASDPRMHDKIHAVHGILQDLGISRKNVVLAFNKMDLVQGAVESDIRARYPDFPCVFVSAADAATLDPLYLEIGTTLA